MIHPWSGGTNLIEVILELPTTAQLPPWPQSSFSFTSLSTYTSSLVHIGFYTLHTCTGLCGSRVQFIYLVTFLSITLFMLFSACSRTKWWQHHCYLVMLQSQRRIEYATDRCVLMSPSCWLADLEILCTRFTIQSCCTCNRKEKW